MILTPESLEEKELVRRLTGELISTCLWNPEVLQADGETREHKIHVWKEQGKVFSCVARKGDYRG